MTNSPADHMAPTLRRDSDLKELSQLVTRLWGETDEQHTEVINTVLEGIEAAEDSNEVTHGTP